MGQSEEMKERFDGLYHKTIPLILFAPTKDSEKFTKALSSLFCSLDNISVFNEVYASLSSSIAGRSQYDHHQETLISSFMEQYISLNQRIRNIEGTYLEFKGMVERINKDHRLIMNHGTRLKEYAPTIEAMRRCKRKTDLKNITYKLPSSTDSNDKVNMVPEKTIKKTEKIGTPVTCECGNEWTFTGTGDRASCRKCHKSFKVIKKVIE